MSALRGKLNRSRSRTLLCDICWSGLPVLPNRHICRRTSDGFHASFWVPWEQWFRNPSANSSLKLKVLVTVHPLSKPQCRVHLLTWNVGYTQQEKIPPWADSLSKHSGTQLLPGQWARVPMSDGQVSTCKPVWKICIHSSCCFFAFSRSNLTVVLLSTSGEGFCLDFFVFYFLSFPNPKSSVS